jgi:hypothetical protein
LVEGSTIVAVSLVRLPQTTEVMEFRRELWIAAENYGLPLLMALLLATPGWPLLQRIQALGLGVGLITLTRLAFLLVRVEYKQLLPVTTTYGSFTLVKPGYSPAKRALVEWLHGFFAFVGPNFFALLLYLGLVALTWHQPEAPGRAGRSRPQPPPGARGSGLRPKRCGGA